MGGIPRLDTFGGFLSFCQCHFILLEVFRQDGATVVRELSISDAYVLVFAVHL